MIQCDIRLNAAKKEVDWYALWWRLTKIQQNCQVFGYHGRSIGSHPTTLKNLHDYLGGAKILPALTTGEGQRDPLSY